MYGCPTCWGRPKLIKKFRNIFPKAKNIVVGNDYTQLFWIFPGIPLLLFSPAPKVHVKRKYESFLDWFEGLWNDHEPNRIKDYIPGPSE
jgi:hypothetical protein